LGALESFTTTLPETIHAFHSSSIPEIGRNVPDPAGFVPERGADWGSGINVAG
jgi:hypothetical protein